ncbi:S26 family signal peptidase [Brevundimonas aurantiaca]|uniref:S26 family signal peptidase n=1 Tax=Brevundimonas aurantiaca TaxID=74316 RepID=UPI00174ECB88|nr:S26 family signal peptidase [Brevundimonas aurantiaca]
MREPGPPSPVRWLAPPHRERRIRARLWLAATAVGLALVGLAAGLAALDPAPRLIWNPSASAPVGLWRIQPGDPVRVGDMVLVETPASVRRLAAERRYLPMNVPLLKRVTAADGDVVCALGPWVFVNGELAATRFEADRQRRPLPWWRGCRTLDGDAVLLLTDAAESFDGRYFGPVERSAIIGRATPLWLP